MVRGGGSRPRQQVTARAEPEPAAIAGPGALPTGWAARRAGGRGWGVPGAREPPLRAPGGAGGAAGARTLEPAWGRFPACRLQNSQPGVVRVRGREPPPAPSPAFFLGRVGAGTVPLALRQALPGAGYARAGSVRNGGFKMSEHTVPGRAPEECPERPVGGGERGAGRGRGAKGETWTTCAGPLPCSGPRIGMGSGLLNGWPASPSEELRLLLFYCW